MSPNIFQNPIAHTLTIPLWARALESKKPDRLFEDKSAERLLSVLPEHCFSFRKNNIMQVGTAIRVHFFDQVLIQAIARLNHPVMVYLGCGLDDRFGRVDTGQGVHVTLDLPEVMALREKIMPADNSRQKSYAISVFDDIWMTQLKSDYPDADFVFTLEGVLMYFPQQSVQNLLRQMASQFHNAQIWFDMPSEFMSAQMNRQHNIQAMHAPFRWGLNNPKIMESWHPKLQHIQTAYYFNGVKRKFGCYNLIHIIPALRKGFKMIGYQIK